MNTMNASTTDCPASNHDQHSLVLLMSFYGSLLVRSLYGCFKLIWKSQRSRFKNWFVSLNKRTDLPDFETSKKCAANQGCEDHTQIECQVVSWAKCKICTLTRSTEITRQSHCSKLPRSSPVPAELLQKAFKFFSPSSRQFSWREGEGAKGEGR